jgi:hypothetical protein
MLPMVGLETQSINKYTSKNPNTAIAALLPAGDHLSDR